MRSIIRVSKKILRKYNAQKTSNAVKNTLKLNFKFLAAKNNTKQLKHKVIALAKIENIVLLNPIDDRVVADTKNPVRLKKKTIEFKDNFIYFFVYCKTWFIYSNGFNPSFFSKSQRHESENTFPLCTILLSYAF